MSEARAALLPGHLGSCQLVPALSPTSAAPAARCSGCPALGDHGRDGAVRRPADALDRADDGVPSIRSVGSRRPRANAVPDLHPWRLAVRRQRFAEITDPLGQEAEVSGGVESLVSAPTRQIAAGCARWSSCIASLAAIGRTCCSKLGKSQRAINCPPAPLATRSAAGGGRAHPSAQSRGR